MCGKLSIVFNNPVRYSKVRFNFAFYAIHVFREISYGHLRIGGWYWKCDESLTDDDKNCTGNRVDCT